MKLLWLDELITIHISALGSFSSIWHALAKGVDPNPPVTYLLVHASRALFGDNEFADRLPAALGYWIGLLSLFLYLRRHVPGTWAIAGTMLLMTMAAFDYSYESRSYGIFSGLAMLAFLCWTWTIDPLREGRYCLVALLGMMVALAAGISTNYFAVLAFVPIAAGEIARTIVRLRRGRRSSHSRLITLKLSVAQAVDIRIWIAMAAAALPLLIYRPLIEHYIAQFAPYAWNKVSLVQVSDSYTEMVEIVLYPILGLFVFAIFVRILGRLTKSLCSECRRILLPGSIAQMVKSRTAILPAEEATGVLFLLIYPFLGYIVASIHGGMLSPRFVIPVCFGFSIAATTIAFQLFQNVSNGGAIFLLFVFAWFICRESCVGYWYEEQKQCFYKIVDRIPLADASVPPNAPIVIPDPLLAPTFEHYAPKAFAKRAVFPVDFPAIRFYRHDDSPEENLWAGRNFLYSLPIVPLATFQKSAGKYLLITSDSNWLLEDLRHHRYEVQRLPIVTRADAIGGFTPLAHGTPVFYIARGDRAPLSAFATLAVPQPFHVADNLPNATQLDPVGGNP